MQRPELLAPAGSMEALKAALRCGADAVYVGGKTFSARQNAANFYHEELGEAIKLCHLYGKKLYLAVNTLIFDSQVCEFAQTIEQALLAGADAFIVQDPGAARIIKEICPGARLHASTQMTVHSPAGAETAIRLGFKRAVLARELSKEQIAEIAALGIETEIFVHGSLCMSVSGRCLMSAFIGRRSANRGLCAQPCRLPFSACENSKFCGLSLKDLSLAEHIGEIKNCGATSLKIEGRMKRPEYVAAAVTAFRNAIDGKPFDMETLRAVFSRSGFTDGYFTGKREDMFGIREKEDVISAKNVLPKLQALYKNERKLTDIQFSAKIKQGQPIGLEVRDGDGNSAKLEGTLPNSAINRALSMEILERQFSKLGNTIYSYGGTQADIDDGLAVGISELNALRRKAVTELDAERVRNCTPTYSISSKALPEVDGITQIPGEIRAKISRFSQFDAAGTADKIIVPTDIFPSEGFAEPEKIIAEPPAFIVDENEVERQLLQLGNMGIKHIMCGNIAYFTLGNRYGFTLHGDIALNAVNSYSLSVVSEMGLCDITLSVELNVAQTAALKSPIPIGMIAYGRIPLMLTRNCPIKNEVGCGKCRKYVTDRTGRRFPVVCHNGYTEIFNSQRLYLADKLEKLRYLSFLTLYFTDEKPSEIRELTEMYRHGGGNMQDITRGLYFRGVL